MLEIDNTTKRLLSEPKTRNAWIIYQAKLKGRTLAQIAREAGVSRQCIYSVFRRPYPRMEKVVADALGMAVNVLWPERYYANGLPINRRGRSKKSVAKETKSTTSVKARNINPRKVA